MVWHGRCGAATAEVGKVRSTASGIREACKIGGGVTGLALVRCATALPPL
jgi:hypothetical protein